MRKLIVLPPPTDRYYDEVVCLKSRLKSDWVEGNLGTLTYEFLTERRIDVVLSGELLPEIYAMLRGMGIVTITFGSLEHAVSMADVVIDCHSEDQVKYFTGPQCSVCENLDFKISSIAELVTVLDWDSKFWGFPVAYLSCMHLTENIYKKVHAFITAKNIRLVEYLCNCHDKRSVNLAERNKFTFTDIRTTFIKKIKQQNQASLPKGFSFRQARPQHIPQLGEITKNLFVHSRYAFDEHFDPAKVDLFYKIWVEKGVHGKLDDECWCLFDKDDPVAFCTVRYGQERSAHIGIMGVHKKYCGKGLGKKLLCFVFDMLLSKGVASVTVVTQGRNIAAQNLYQSVGFRTKATELWYHKWC